MKDTMINDRDKTKRDAEMFFVKVSIRVFVETFKNYDVILIRDENEFSRIALCLFLSIFCIL